MEAKNKKIILTSLVAILIIIVITFVVMITKKDKVDNSSIDTPVAKIEKIEKEEGVTPLTEEKKAELAAIKNITGKIIAIGDSEITVKTETEELKLNISTEVNFYTQTLQEDGSFLVKEIELSDLPKDKDAQIQYNGSSNNVMMISVQ